MKKKLFMYFLIAMFVFFIGLYTYNTIEDIMVKRVDLIKEDLDEKTIIFFEETVEDNTCFGKYLQNNGVIYSFSYEYDKEDTLENKLLKMKDLTESKHGSIKRRDKGYLNMYVDDLKAKYYQSKLSTDKPSTFIYYVDYKKNRDIIVISSGGEVYKNRSLSSSRIISILKKYSIRVD